MHWQLKYVKRLKKKSFFYRDHKDHIVLAVKHVFTEKELPISQRLGIIACLPKDDKPR